MLLQQLKKNLNYIFPDDAFDQLYLTDRPQLLHFVLVEIASSMFTEKNAIHRPYLARFCKEKASRVEPVECPRAQQFNLWQVKLARFHPC